MNSSEYASADPLGLFWYLSWLSGHGIWTTLLLCLLVTPVAMMVIAPVGETRWLPLGSKHQFQSFFPGDIFLGIGAAILLRMAGDLPAEERWYNNFWWHLSLQLVTIIAAAWLTYGEFRERNVLYPARALRSPTKAYHNAGLYVAYGYVVVATLVAVLFGGAWSKDGAFNWKFSLVLATAIAFLYQWLKRVIADGRLRKTNPRAFKAKIRGAHIADWQPIWTTIARAVTANRASRP